MKQLSPSKSACVCEEKDREKMGIEQAVEVPFVQ